MKTRELLNKDKPYTREEITALLALDDHQDIKLLFSRADEIRKKHFANKVYLRGMIEFSNYCTQNCLYCGIREDNLRINRYRMTPDEILETAKVIYSYGIRTIILQSGEDSYYDTDLISYIIYSIKKKFDVAITLSVGERGFEEYQTWKIAGADRYLMKHETANPKLYSIYHKESRLADRINHLKYLKRLGYQIGSGNMIGLPLQGIDDIADDLLLCEKLDVDMAAFGPFIPANNTPYQKKESISADFVLQVIAVARVVLETAHIPSTSALDSLDSNGRVKGLSAGANVIMPNFTPQPYRRDYQIYKNKPGINDDPLNTNNEIMRKIEEMGWMISFSKGHSIKYAKSAS